MHAIFEFIPLILFFIVYKMYDIYWGTASLIVASIVQILIFIIRKKPVPKMNWIVLALITVFGGLTIYLHDDTFLKWKVSILYGLMASALLFSRYILSNNLIKKMLEESLELPSKVWDRLNLAWTAFFLSSAVANWYIAFHFSQETWVNFKVFGLTGFMIVFLILMLASIYKYLPQEESETQSSSSNTPE